MSQTEHGISPGCPAHRRARACCKSASFAAPVGTFQIPGGAFKQRNALGSSTKFKVLFDCAMRLTISACLSTINLLSAAHIMSYILLLHDSPPSFPSIVSSQHPPKTSTTRGREGGREGGREKIAAMPLCATIGASVMRFLNSICIICNRVERQSRVGFLPSSSSNNNHTEMHRESWRFTWHPITRTSSWMGIPATFPLPPPLALDMAAMASALSASLISSSPSSALTTGGLFWWFDSRWGRGRKAGERTGVEYLVVGMEMRVVPTSLVGNACGTTPNNPHLALRPGNHCQFSNPTLCENHLKSPRYGEKRPILVARPPRRGAGVCGNIPCTLRRGLGSCLQVPSTRATCPYSSQFFCKIRDAPPLQRPSWVHGSCPLSRCLPQPQSDQVEAHGSRAEPPVRRPQAGARAGPHRPGLRLHKNPLHQLAPALATNLQIDALCQHGLQPSIVAFQTHSLSPYSHHPES